MAAAGNGPNVVTLVVDKIGTRDVAGGAASPPQLLEGPVEYHPSPFRCRRGIVTEAAVGFQIGIGEKIELEHVGDDAVHQDRLRFRPVELVDDYIADELTQ